MAQSQEEYPERRHGWRDDELTAGGGWALHCSIVQAGLREAAPAAIDGMLGGMDFGAFDAAFLSRTREDFAVPCAALPMPPLNDAGTIGTVDTIGTVCERWTGTGAPIRGRIDAVRYSHDADTLFGVVEIDETGLPVPAVPDHGAEGIGTPLQRAAESAYGSLFRVIDALGFPHILRFWNYMADINGESHGLERYRQFNLGRQAGFRRAGRATGTVGDPGGAGNPGAGAVPTNSIPAASAVGFASGPLTVCFLASRHARPVAIENPRQVSAYLYPSEYGPRSPTFSRASVVRLADRDLLLVSGTASIVGHRTLHAGNAAAQTRETIANLAAIVEQANRAAPDAGFVLSDLCCKVYVRHPHDYPAIRDVLRSSLGASARMLFVKADICRQDLLVEIEATAGHAIDFCIAA